ncbi:hypothetical protein SAMN05421849_2194 [Pontibaca methylaminivorans]|uniref:Uncharacterized protein n=1 Tax=Pontibaca methylaminivorans TaxID=515897 RepID=A0A1R3X2B5_9RHOB|nr:hypothetical protein SAMN05421849_2194 [Pontibaca methylaminivorans]
MKKDGAAHVVVSWIIIIAITAALVLIGKYFAGF